MKRYFSIIFLCIFTLQAEPIEPKDDTSINMAALQVLLAMNAPNDGSTRAPTPPNFLGFPLGSVIFQGYNGGGTTPYTQGANIGGYSALPSPTTPTANQTFPANTIFTTIAATGTTGLARLSIQSNGRVGIGNFMPTSTTLANAALNVEGSTLSVADSTVHVGSRTTALNGFTGMTGNANVNYNLQVDGNMLVSDSMLINNGKAVTACNVLPGSFITSTPITISTPGVYYVANNIIHSGTSAAIVISTSGVVLDLQGFTITYTGATAALNGVNINTASTTDIMIMNGTFKDFTGAGVFSNVTGLERIAVQNISAVGCGLRGINLVGGGDTVYIDNCKVIDCGAVATNLTMIAIANFNNVYLNACSVINSTVSASTFRGIGFTAVANLIASDCYVANCTGPASRGYNLDTVTGGKLIRCHASGNTNTAATTAVTGMRIESCTAIECYECCMLGNTSTTSATSVVGTHVVGSTDVVFDRCVMASQSQTAGGAATLPPTGLHIDNASSGVVVRDSTFYNNNGEATLVPKGIECRGNNCLFENCAAYSQVSTTGTLTGIGFGLTATSTTLGLNNSFINCNAFNQNLGFALVLSGGALNTQNRYIKNVSTKNTTNYSAFPVGSTTATTLAGLNAITNPWTNISLT